MKSILLTGAGGFIGGHLLSRFSDKFKIFAFGKKLNGIAKKFTSIELIEGNISDKNIYRNLPNKIDYIIHLAAMTDIQKIEESPDEALNVNCNATLYLLEYAKKIKVNHFVYVSTGSVYKPQNELFTEELPVNPSNMYGFFKYLGELVSQRYEKYFPISILRLFHPFGVGQPGTKLIPRFIKKIKNGDTIILHPDKKPLLSFIYIDNLIEIFARVIDLKPSTILNVAGTNATIFELCRLLGELLRVKPKFTIDNIIVENEAADISKMKYILDYNNFYSLEDGLKELVLGLKKRV